ncbi:MAG: branched-chain amino acid ABC transporter permease [Pusillimonas sp.]|nr:branched-chain amino acid ABC transporter permease [Pusillimonas sp.]|tara:strand:- start:141279 stop:142265 length:987 start_codon:yes stop_codon:yes gene_type:complete
MNTQSNRNLVVGAFRRQRYNLADVALVAAAILTLIFGEYYLALAAMVVIMAIFALSLDLAQGYGGVESLGHAAFFGVGAYAAALYALHVSSEPISGLLVGAIAAGLAGLLSGFAVLRTQGLTQLMLTLAVASLLYELANVAKSITNGDDGLTGYDVDPVLGLFQFDIFGFTGFVYACVVLLLVYALLKKLVNASIGQTAQGIRENQTRMRMLGVPVERRLWLLYTISAAIAGIAGALSAQINRIVGLDSLAFTLSANVLVMLALGGPGRLYGAIFGAILFVLLSDRAAAIDPTNWLAVLGIVLILIVRYAPDGLAGLVSRTVGKRSAK